MSSLGLNILAYKYIKEAQYNHSNLYSENAQELLSWNHC